MAWVPECCTPAQDSIKNVCMKCSSGDITDCRRLQHCQVHITVAKASGAALRHTQLWRFCAVNVLATFVAVAFMDKVGRRKLLIIASVWMFVTQIIVAGTLGAEFQKHGADLPRGVSISMLIVRTGLLLFLRDLKFMLSRLAGLACQQWNGCRASVKSHSCVRCCQRLI